MIIALSATCLILCSLVGYWLTGRVLNRLRTHAILDLPNDRSSHTIPTPRGGGWAVMLTLLAGWGLLALLEDYLGAGSGTITVWPILIASIALMGISWADDRRGLGPAPRFAAQMIAVVVGCATLPADGLVFQGYLPFWADRILAGIGWLWFVNLFNFMDGIDGLAGGEAASIGIGVALITGVAALDPLAGLYGLTAAGAAIGFLWWNWHPAKLFMGDVGSIPLGFTLGWLLLLLAAAGLWQAALLIPAYFLTDATWTLLRRLLTGKKIWQAHREHFYQQATRSGHSHAQVSRAVLLLNAVLIILALVSLSVGWPSLVAGAIAVGVLLFWMVQPNRVSA